MQSLKTNKTWILVKKPDNQKVVDCRWLYKVKEGNLESDPPRFKARLVACGNEQLLGVNYGLTFAAVMEMSTVNVILVFTRR